MLSIIIIIIASVKKTSSNNNSSNKLNYGIGQITCTYNIKNISEKTKILGYDYINDENIGIIYENKMITSVKEFEFKNIGNEKIIFVINNNNLNLDNMFKNVTSLISVEIKSEKNLSISSMTSVFESCQNLVNISIIGIDTNPVKSMKKLFYKTSLNDLYFPNIDTKNVIDMSYMFSSTSFTQLNLLNYNTE